MKKYVLLVMVAVSFSLTISCSGDKKDIELETNDERFSYVMGYEAVGVLDNLETVTIDEEAFIAGIRDAFDNTVPFLSQEQGLDIKAVVFEKERAYRNRQIMKDTEKNLADQKAFLERNAAADGVIATDSGLQYRILNNGDGPMPSPEDKVKIIARARRLDGTLVKSLSTRGTDSIIPVKGELPFWEKTLTLMPAGSSFRFFVPSDLAYGSMGNFIDGGVVGPNQLIVIDINLLEVKPSTAS